MNILDSDKMHFDGHPVMTAAQVLANRRNLDGRKLSCPTSLDCDAVFDAGLSDGCPVIVSCTGERLLFQRVIDCRKRAAETDVICPMSVESVVELAHEKFSTVYSLETISFLADLKTRDLQSFMEVLKELLLVDGVEKAVLNKAIKEAPEKGSFVAPVKYSDVKCPALDFWREVLERDYLLSDDENIQGSYWKDDVSSAFSDWCKREGVECSSPVFWKQTTDRFFQFQTKQKRKNSKPKRMILVPGLYQLREEFSAKTGHIFP